MGGGWMNLEDYKAGSSILGSNGCVLVYYGQVFLHQADETHAN